MVASRSTAAHPTYLTDATSYIRTGGIVWTPYNKIDRIKKVSDAGVQIMKLAYLYDAAGNRVVKDHYATDTTTHTTRTYYVRDAQGNVMGIFKRTMSGYDIERQETPIYGSTRLGVAYKGALHTTGVVDTLAHHNAIYTRALRQRGYELTDHLGNVRATVSDMLIPRSGGVFDADLRTLTDYYPFGMQMPERTYEAAGIAGHRYGFNGKENDDDVKGEGNQQDYGFRIYDPRVARFLSVDPLTKEYPGLTLYQFSSNTPIWALDRDGLEARVYTDTIGTGHTLITLGTGDNLVVYTYGRYTNYDIEESLGTGAGVLLRFTGDVARGYLTELLYERDARAFEVKDANETALRSLFQRLWDSGRLVAPSETDKPNVINYGRVINDYDLVSFNCTTIVCDALKLTGSSIFNDEAYWGLIFPQFHLQSTRSSRTL